MALFRVFRGRYGGVELILESCTYVVIVDLVTLETLRSLPITLFNYYLITTGIIITSFKSIGQF